MFKLIVTRGEKPVKEFALEAKEIFIGRDPGSDITLLDASVSRRHARLVRVMNSYFLEDLDSTNGTQRNFRPITKHLMKHGDEIRIGGFTLYFVDEQEAAQKSVEQRSEMPGDPSPGRSPSTIGKPEGANKVNLPKTARLRFFRGPNAGRTEVLGRGIYTIGKPGEEVAAIARRPQGFFLLPIGGQRNPRINNQEVLSIAGVKLNEADVVEVGENLAEISFSQAET